MYDHGARNRNPVSTLWYGIDPLFEKYPDFSPYNYCAGNPVVMVDVDGRDIITVDDNGFVSKVDTKPGDNMFYDKKGNQLFFNDPENADKERLSSGYFEKGARVYMNLRFSDVSTAITNVRQNKDIKDGNSRYWNICKASYGDADFTFSFLDSYYEKNRNPESEPSIMVTEHGFIRSEYQEDIIYFRFENTNTLYNLYDSGNFMWGAWSSVVGITDSEAEWGPSLNEIFTGGDSDADQCAIRNGRYWIKNMSK